MQAHGVAARHAPRPRPHPRPPPRGSGLEGQRVSRPSARGAGPAAAFSLVRSPTSAPRIGGGAMSSAVNRPGWARLRPFGPRGWLWRTPGFTAAEVARLLHAGAPGARADAA